jgi:hypothetical protein
MSEPPPYNEPKYIIQNGITKLNPKYNAAVPLNEKTSLRYPESALAVVSTMEDYFAYNDAASSSNLPEKPLTKNVNDAINYLQDPNLKKSIGMTGELTDSLLAVFGKYEIPIGMLSKLFELTDYEVLEFIIDDSGSMNSPTDSNLPNSNIPMTRWQEVFYRLKTMFEILAYIPVNQFRLRFLNRASTAEYTFRHFSGQSPEEFMQLTNRLFDKISRELPTGCTPVLSCFERSFYENKGKKVSIYFFGDGEPDAGTQQRFEKMIINRENPKNNPITFLSCTGDDEKVEWMKELEEVAEYCAEYDDFSDESDEVLYDQGHGLPFTKGFHLIGQLVAAMNPYDLDAMDESIPFTKTCLDRLLGVTHSAAEYNHYFNLFCKAQKKRIIKNELDRFKQNFKWENCYKDFFDHELPTSINSVSMFKVSLKEIQSNSYQNSYRNASYVNPDPNSYRNASYVNPDQNSYQNSYNIPPYRPTQQKNRKKKCLIL